MGDKPFCVIGGEVIGNVPTIEALEFYIKDYIKNELYGVSWAIDEVNTATRSAIYEEIEDFKSKVIGQLEYKGVWDASGEDYPDDPELGWYYVISVAGTMGGVDYIVNDWIVYNGVDWDKIAGERIIDLSDIPTRLHNDLQVIGYNDHISDLVQIPTRLHNNLQVIGYNDHINDLNQIPTRLHNDLQVIGFNDHIDNLSQITTRNHSDLQGVSASQHHVKPVNLNELSTRNHGDLQNIGVSDHHQEDVVGIKKDYFGVGIKGNIATRDYEISVANGDDFDMIGWYVANGYASTPNCIDKFTRNEAISGVVGGSDDAVVVTHLHRAKLKLSQAEAGTAVGVLSATGAYWDNTIELTGVSGVDKNIPAKISAIPIIRMS